MTQYIYLQHIVGRCPLEGALILDNGSDDDPQHWEHSFVHLPFEQRGRYDAADD